MSTFRIAAHDRFDKSFMILGPLGLEVDNDDVPTDQVAILAEHLVEILNDHWRPCYAWFCENEDCERYMYARSVSVVQSTRCDQCGLPITPKEISL